MYIGEIIADNYFDVQPHDSVRFAHEKMEEYHTTQLPVVNGSDYIGIISEDQLLEVSDDRRAINSFSSSLKPFYLYEYQHIYDALQYASAHLLHIIPVLDTENKYIGIVTTNDLLVAVNKMLSNNEPGAIIVLEIAKNNVSFSHIAHILEAENVHILHIAVHDVPDSTKVEMTIKVDKQNIASVVASLWRFDYVVKATFNDGSRDSDIKERYDILMNYLNL